MGKNHYIGGGTEIYISDRSKSLKRKIYRELRNEVASSYLSYNMVDSYFKRYRTAELEEILEDVKIDYQGRRKLWLWRIKGETKAVTLNKDKSKSKDENRSSGKSRKRGNIGYYFKGSLLNNNAVGKMITFGDVSGRVTDINNQRGILKLECSRGKTEKKFSINFIYDKYVKQV